MNSEENSAAGFRKSHPIDFSLFDNDHHLALYIDDDPAGHELKFEVHNTSAQTLQFTNGQGQTASEQNYHFELRFRPGTLSANTLTKLRDSQAKNQVLADPEWDLYMPAAPAQTLSLYLLYKGNYEWLPDERRTVTLNHLSADAGNGARGTRVELKPNQITYAGDPTPIAGTRIHHLSIVNHRGRKNIPLHVGFVGPNRVLNDGVVHENNPLRLLLTNTSPRDSAAFNLAKAKFIISVDTGERDKEWALATAAEAKAITVAVKRGDTWEEIPDATADQAISPEWIISGPLLPSTHLSPGTHLEIRLANIATLHPSGPANVYLRYENIPGYWDGQFVVAVEKAPLLFSGQNVGIGIPNSRHKLEVAGNIVGANLSLARTNTTRGALFLATNGDFNHALYNNYSNVDGEGSWDGAKWNVYAGLNVRVRAGNAKETAMSIDANGKLGIGTSTPEAKLHIVHNNQNEHGNTLILGPTNQSNLRMGYHQDYSWIQSHGLKPLSINPAGNHVGIGTTSPQAALDIKGELQVTGDVRVEGNIYKKAGDWWHLLLEVPAVPRIWPPPPPVTEVPTVWRRQSDGRLKHQVRQIDQALAKITELKGITFEWNEAGLQHLTREIEARISAGPDATPEENEKVWEAARQQTYQALSGSNVGLVAQDVEQVLPELVDTDEGGYKTVRYDLLTALLVEAVKELREVVEGLSERVLQDNETA